MAEVIKDLDDRGTILWGCFYQDDRRNDREGDFLVLEAENTVSRWFSATGPWEGESGIARTSKSKCKVETPARIL